MDQRLPETIDRGDRHDRDRACRRAHARSIQAVGDGDHGLNMVRGFKDIMGAADDLARQPLPDALRAIGTKLVMKVGGASGPLYGTLFLTLGKNLPTSPTREDAARALGTAVAAVMARGKSEPGRKDHA